MSVDLICDSKYQKLKQRCFQNQTISRGLPLEIDHWEDLIMRLAKRFFALFLSMLMLVVGIPKGSAMYGPATEGTSIIAPPISMPYATEELTIAVVAYSDESWAYVRSNICPNGDFAIGNSPADNKNYRIRFLKLEPYQDLSPEDYVSRFRHEISSCSGCMFIYDLSEVYQSYNGKLSEGELKEPWEMREYGLALREKCRRWCHTIEAVNPGRYFLFVPDARRLHDTDISFWGGYACDDICDCETSWIETHPGHPQFVDAMVVPPNLTKICPIIFRKLPLHQSVHSGTIGGWLKKNKVEILVGATILLAIGVTIVCVCTGGGGNNGSSSLGSSEQKID